MTDQNSPKKGNKDDDRKKKNRQKLPPDDKFNWKKSTRTLTLWILIVIGSWIIFHQLNVAEQPEVQKSYTEYRQLLEDRQFDSADIIDQEFHGQLKDGGQIITVLPFVDAAMLAEWDSLKIDYRFREKTTSWVGYLITSILPWVIIIAIWLYFIRRMQGGGGAGRGVFSFGKSRAKLLTENTRKITFDDVAGCDEAKEELSEVIEFLQDPKKFSRLGGRIPTGALLLGPPGTGKTLLARAVAGEAEVPFYSMSGADFVEMFVGVGASRVRDLFEQGKKNAPCIIFIDEIDAVGRHRGAGMGGGHDEREQTLNQLLVEMDGFESNDGVILIAATNRPDVLDPALTRPGRFDRQIVVDRPDVRGREGIIKVHTRNIPLGRDVKITILAKGTPGLSGADLANLVNEAALLAARRNVNRVWMEDFENAKDKVMMGTERKSVLISKDEKHHTAVHEAGHVLVAILTPGSDPVHKVTIIPRGRALGVTHYLPMDEKHSYSRTYLNRVLIALLGGRASERIIFNELSTGAGNDIERATEIARKMVCEWGMSNKLGPIALGSKHEEVFLGRDFAQQRNYSERTAQDVDNEIRRIVTDAEKQAEKLINANLEKLKLLSEGLLEREILDGHEITVLLRDGKLPPVRARQGIIKPKRRPVRSKKPVSATKQQPKPSEKQPQRANQPPQKSTQPQQRSNQPPQRNNQPPQREKQPPKPADKPNLTGSASGNSQTRRQLAKDYGVISSRDNLPSRYTHRPKPAQNRQEPPKKESEPPKPKPQVRTDSRPSIKPVPKQDPPVRDVSDIPITADVDSKPTPPVETAKGVGAKPETESKPTVEEKTAVEQPQSETAAVEDEKPKRKPVRRGRKPKAAADKESEKKSDDKGDTKAAEEKPKPKTTRRGRKPKAAVDTEAKGDSETTEEKPKPKTTRRGRKPKAAADKKAEKKPDVKGDAEATEEKPKPKPARRGRKPKAATAKKTEEKSAAEPVKDKTEPAVSDKGSEAVTKQEPAAETAAKQSDQRQAKPDDKPERVVWKASEPKPESPQDLVSTSSLLPADSLSKPIAPKTKDATGLFSSPSKEKPFEPPVKPATPIVTDEKNAD